ncbi:MAG: TIGR01620 family protein [Devosiaceae bacterium]|nr:TIGR01620 family protein [Devosiaceae bacterium]
MRKPTAQTIKKKKPSPKATINQDSSGKSAPAREPKAFAPQMAEIEIVPQNNHFQDEFSDSRQEEAFPKKSKSSPSGWIIKLSLAAASVLIALGLSLMADRLIGDLFARYEWLGWVGTGAVAILVLGIVVLTIRELAALRSLKNLDGLRLEAKQALISDLPKPGKAVIARLNRLYGTRADLARANQLLGNDLNGLLDGSDMIATAERHLMTPLDERAKALTAAAARRVAIVSAISPRAIVDLAFVAYESLKLARAIATLYGARPGFFGSWRLAGAILSHLAVTGGVALGDSVIQQMLGHGLAAKLSARLGEGLVNGLMSVRVGVAAIKTTRPLPFDQLKQPKVMDFMSDLAKFSK